MKDMASVLWCSRGISITCCSTDDYNFIMKDMASVLWCSRGITCCSTDYNFIMKDLASVLWCSRAHWSAALPPRNPTWWCCCWLFFEPTCGAWWYYCRWCMQNGICCGRVICRRCCYSLIFMFTKCYPHCFSMSTQHFTAIIILFSLQLVGAAPW